MEEYFRNLNKIEYVIDPNGDLLGSNVYEQDIIEIINGYNPK